jgi:hypothetical protein
MSHFSYRGAGLEMADDEEESTFTPAPSSASAVPAPAPLLPPRLHKSQEFSSIPSFLNPMNAPLNASTSYHHCHDEERIHNRTPQTPTEEVFSTIETIPHCDDDYSDRLGNTEGHRTIGTGDEKKQQRTDESIHPSFLSDSRATEESNQNLRHDWPLNIGESSAVYHGQGQVGSNPVLQQNRPNRDPIALDGDDDEDDKDDDDHVSNSNGPERKHTMDHEVDYDDDFIKSFLDHAVDAPCQRFTVAPCMADLMDRQLDLFMVRGI